MKRIMKCIAKPLFMLWILSALVLLPAATSMAAAANEPGAVRNFRVASRSNRTLILKWSKAKNADGYIIYRYSPNTGATKKLGKTTDILYETPKLTAGKTYSFKIKSYRKIKGKTYYGPLSEAISGTVKKIDVSSIHPRYYNTTLKSDTKITYLDTQKKKTLKKGTRLIAHSRSGSTVTATTTDGRKVRVSGSSLSYGSLNVETSYYYTKAQMEAFVNSRGYTSDTDYLIWISQYTTCTAIFKGSRGEWKLVRRCASVVGKDGATPQRIFKLVHVGRAYGGPFLYIRYFPSTRKGYGFHRRVSADKRGALSGGCIRLSNADLDYMHEYCPLGTTVVSY